MARTAATAAWRQVPDVAGIGLQLDDEVLEWLRESYEVGAQRG